MKPQELTIIESRDSIAVWKKSGSLFRNYPKNDDYMYEITAEQLKAMLEKKGHTVTIK